MRILHLLRTEPTNTVERLIESEDFERLKGKASLALCDFSFRSL